MRRIAEQLFPIDHGFRFVARARIICAERQERAQVGDTGDVHGAAVGAGRIEDRAGQGRIAAIGRAENRDALRIDDTLFGEMRDAVDQVALHLAPPFAVAGIFESQAVAGRATIVGLQHGIAARGKSLGFPVEIDEVARRRTAVRQHDQGQVFRGLAGWQGQVGMDIQPVRRLVVDPLLLGDPRVGQVGIVVGDLRRVAGGKVDEEVASGVGRRFGVDQHLARILGEIDHRKAITFAQDLRHGFGQLFHERVGVIVGEPLVMCRKPDQAARRRMEQGRPVPGLGVEWRAQDAVRRNLVVVVAAAIRILDRDDDRLAVASQADEAGVGFGALDRIDLFVTRHHRTRGVVIEFPFLVVAARVVIELRIGEGHARRRQDPALGMLRAFVERVGYIPLVDAEAVQAQVVFAAHLVT